MVPGCAEDGVDLRMDERVFEHELGGTPTALRGVMRSWLPWKVCLERLDRLFRRRVRIGVWQGLGAAITVVADLPQGGGDGGIIEVPQAGGTAVGIDEVDMADVALRRADGNRQINLFDIHVEQVGQQ